jgi:hypothetical protein
MRNLAPLALILCTLLPGCGKESSQEPGTGGAPGTATQANGGQEARFMPEVDTGGFLIYQPPAAVMVGKGPSDHLAWTGAEWPSPSWVLGGFAYADWVDASDPTKGYVVDLWLCESNANAPEFTSFVRVGAVLNGSVSDGPLLYDAQLDSNGKKLSRAAFQALILGKLTSRPSEFPKDKRVPGFHYWRVTEVPGS